MGWQTQKKFPFDEKLTMHFLYYQQVRYDIDILVALQTCHILQAGYTVRTHEDKWRKMYKFNEDDQNEEMYWRGEADPDSFIHSPSIIQPEHFMCLFLIMGFIMSIGLIVLLWDILTNPTLTFYGLMLAGLFACLLITFNNFFYFFAACLRPTTRESDDGRYDITTGDYEIDKKILINNKTVAIAILGYGAVTSFIFIFAAMIRSLGKTHFL